MQSIEQQLYALNSAVRKLQDEVYRLHKLDRNGAQCHPNSVLKPSPEPNYEEIFNIASMKKGPEYMDSPLTYRETQILNYIADGTTNKQIAYILETSNQTIKNHVSTILRKLKANDRAHAVALAIRNGWISNEIEQEDMVAIS